MRFEVHHLNWEGARERNADAFAGATFSGEVEAVRVLQAQGLYAHVATVAVAEADESAALEEVYRLTNSIDRHWSKNPEITLTGDGRLRSTSMGDLVCIEDRWYLVADMGFTPLPQDGEALRA